MVEFLLPTVLVGSTPVKQTDFLLNTNFFKEKNIYCQPFCPLGGSPLTSIKNHLLLDRDHGLPTGWLSWLSIGLLCGRSWDQKLQPDQHSGSLNNWGESAAFIMTYANGYTL